MSDIFPIKNDFKQGDALSPLLFNFALEYIIRRVELNQNGLKVNGTHQLLVYADDVNIMDGNIHTTKKNTEARIFANKEIGQEENADKTKYMVMFRVQNAGRRHNIKKYNSSFTRVQQFKYVEIIVTNQNSIQEEM